MSLAIVQSRAQTGISAKPVTVEVHLSNGFPGMTIVGLPETAVKESKDRVRSAILNSRYTFPARRMTINLAPADLPKEGSRFDLPIALGILAASGQIPVDSLKGFEFAGELALTGELRGIKGALPMAIAAQQAGHQLFLPQINQSEASLIEDLPLFCANHLLKVVNHLNGQEKRQPIPHQTCSAPPLISLDLADIKGQEHAKQALIVAAAGQHNLLLIGPPGTGKTMLASRLTGILPPLTQKEALASATIASIKGQPLNHQNFFKRAFRSPHHTASAVAMVGGGAPPKPGEISLAHHGVLFLDELPEFDRKVLEVLREPLETHEITISRANHQITYPAQFQLIAAMNPCPCGYKTSTKRECVCSNHQLSHYQRKLSGPLLDRFDMQIEVPDLPIEELTQAQRSPLTSELAHEQVNSARAIQYQRQGKLNSELGPQELETVCVLHPQEKKFIQHAMEKLNISARAYHRVLKLARTLADLNEKEAIERPHLAAALSWRRLSQYQNISA